MHVFRNAVDGRGQATLGCVSGGSRGCSPIRKGTILRGRWVNTPGLQGVVFGLRLLPWRCWAGQCFVNEDNTGQGDVEGEWKGQDRELRVLLFEAPIRVLRAPQNPPLLSPTYPRLPCPRPLDALLGEDAIPGGSLIYPWAVSHSSGQRPSTLTFCCLLFPSSSRFSAAIGRGKAALHMMDC
ncbi:hypothetical protein VTI74DRAFT_11397 [Chaetomium olivicolor]